MFSCCFPFPIQYDSSVSPYALSANSSPHVERSIDLPSCVIYPDSFKVKIKKSANRMAHLWINQVVSDAFKHFSNDKIYCEINHLHQSIFFYRDGLKSGVQSLHFFPRSQSGSRSPTAYLKGGQESKQIETIKAIQSLYQKVEVSFA